jgi:hypothetical protein
MKIVPFPNPIPARVRGSDGPFGHAVALCVPNGPRTLDSGQADVLYLIVFEGQPYWCGVAEVNLLPDRSLAVRHG